MGNGSSRPPRLAGWLLTVLLPRAWAERIRRDLGEAFVEWVEEERGAEAARRWYWRNSVASVAHVWGEAGRIRLTQGVGMMGIGNDIQTAVRTLRRRPGFTLAAAATLALGIGAATAVYSVVDQVLLRPLDLPEPDRLVAIWSVEEGEISNSSGPNLLDLKAGVEAFEDTYIFSRSNAVLESFDGVRRNVATLEVTAGMLNVLGVGPELGRGLESRDGDEGAAPVVLLSQARWKSDFGGDPSVLGRQIVVDGRASEIVGILPADLKIPMGQDPDLIAPITRTGTFLARDLVWLGAIARLRTDVSVEEALAEASGVWEGLREAYPDALLETGVAVLPLQTYLVEDVRTALLVLMAGAGVLLLMACVNVAGLLFAHGRSRQAEFAVRASLGAARARLLRQLLLEGGLLTVTAAIIGVGLAYAGVGVLLGLAPQELVSLGDVSLDFRILVASLGISLAAGMGASVLPAIRATRTDPAQQLTGRGAAGRGRGEGRQILVLLQVAAACVLLAGAGLLGRSLLSLASVDPGYRINGIVTAEVALPQGDYPDRELRTATFIRLEEEARSVPGVEDAGITLMRPLSDARINFEVATDGMAPLPAGEAPVADLQLASGGHFRTLEFPILAGRVFHDNEGIGDPRVAVVSQSLSEELWPGQSAIGHQVRFVANRDAEPMWYEVVGIVGDVYQQGVGEPTYGTLYVSVLQLPQNTVTLSVRVRGEEARIATALRALVSTVAPGAPEPEITTMKEAMRTTLAASRFNALLFSAFAGLALLLTGVGIYGTLSYAVLSRKGEIGVRMALGASQGGIVGKVVRDGLGPLVLGLLVGLGTSLALAGFVADLVFGIPARDPITFLLVAGTLLVVGAVAAAIPAWRAARVDPVRALRAGG